MGKTTEIELTPEAQAELEVAAKKQERQDWIDNINKEADEKAAELSTILNAEVVPVVYIIEPLKDAAVGFLKQPDAKQALKILDAMITDNPTGLELGVRSQLVREVTGFEGVASDSRFMDVNGKYDPKYSVLNMSIMLRFDKMMIIFSDMFKKK